MYSEVLLRSYEGHNPGTHQAVFREASQQVVFFSNHLLLFLSHRQHEQSLPVYVAGAEEWFLSKTLGVPAEIFFLKHLYSGLGIILYTVLFCTVYVHFHGIFYYSEFVVFLLE